MIIDAHYHIPQDWSQPSQVARLLRIASRFDIGWLAVCMGRTFQARPTVEEVREANDYVLSLMQAWPERIAGYCYLNPRLGRRSLAEMDRCLDAGMRGVKLWIACPCDAPHVYPIVERAIQRDVPILQHTWKKTGGNEPDESTPRHMARLAERYPRAKLIMAHAGGAWEYGIKAIRHCPNVTIDTSGGNPTQGLLEMALQDLGPDRILYGSDGTMRGFASQLAKIDGVRLDRATRRRILCDNAARLLRLPVKQSARN